MDHGGVGGNVEGQAGRRGGEVGFSGEEQAASAVLRVAHEVPDGMGHGGENTGAEDDINRVVDLPFSGMGDEEKGDTEAVGEKFERIEDFFCGSGLTAAGMAIQRRDLIDDEELQV